MGAGDTALHAGKPADALKFYQQSLAVGVEDRNVPVIQVSAFGAGNACLELSRHQEAKATSGIFHKQSSTRPAGSCSRRIASEFSVSLGISGPRPDRS